VAWEKEKRKRRKKLKEKAMDMDRCLQETCRFAHEAVEEEIMKVEYSSRQT